MEGRVECPLCELELSGGDELLEHVLTHDGEQGAFSCPTCRKVCYGAAAFGKHLRQHVAVRPYSCTQCNKSFRDKCSLTRHQKTTHTSGERPFSCEICEKRFADIGSYGRHKKTHMGDAAKIHGCEYCGKAFLDRSSLNRHVKTHTREKPFQCQVCRKCFTESGSFKRHQRVHTGEKRFQCQTCGRRFAERASMLRHERNNVCNLTSPPIHRLQLQEEAARTLPFSTGSVKLKSSDTLNNNSIAVDGKDSDDTLDYGDLEQEGFVAVGRMVIASPLRSAENDRDSADSSQYEDGTSSLVGVRCSTDRGISTDHAVDRGSVLGSLHHNRNGSSSSCNDTFSTYSASTYSRQSSWEQEAGDKRPDTVCTLTSNLLKKRLIQTKSVADEDASELKSTRLCFECGETMTDDEEESLLTDHSEARSKRLHRCSSCRHDWDGVINWKSNNSKSNVHRETHCLESSKESFSGVLTKGDPISIQLLKVSGLEDNNNSSPKFVEKSTTPDCKHSPAVSEDTAVFLSTERKRYICSKCGKRFSDWSKLKRHVKTHLGVRDFRCPTCGKGFIEACSLRRHQSVHSNVKPHSCMRCGRGFTDSSGLKKHLVKCRTEASSASRHVVSDGVFEDGTKDMGMNKPGNEAKCLCKSDLETDTTGNVSATDANSSRFLWTGIKVEPVQVEDSQKTEAVDVGNKLKYLNGTSLGFRLNRVKSESKFHCKSSPLPEAGYFETRELHSGQTPDKIHSSHTDVKVDSTVSSQLFGCISKEDGVNLPGLAMQVEALNHLYKPPLYLCAICGAACRDENSLKHHYLGHMGSNLSFLGSSLEDLVSCGVCGKRFVSLLYLEKHMMKHQSSAGSAPALEVSPQNQDPPSAVIKASTPARTLCSVGGSNHRAVLRKSRGFSSIEDLLTVQTIGDVVSVPPQPSPTSWSQASASSCSVSPPSTLRGDHQCAACSKVFSDLGSLKRHSRLHTDNQQHTCDICCKVFGDLGSLKRHWLRGCRNGTVKGKSRQTGDCGEFPCTQCYMVLYSRAEQMQHEKEHRVSACLRCGVCGKSCADQATLAVHKQKHAYERPHCCEVCHKGFADLGALAKHRSRGCYAPANAVLDTSKLPCVDCGKVFSEQTVLDQHTCHGGVKRHACSQCGKSFTEVCSLKRHMRLHTGQNLCKCLHCGHTFLENSGLKKHLERRSCLREKKVRKSFLYACTVCQKVFTKRYMLIRHMKTHLGLRPFECDRCEKSFTESSSLKRHYRQHTGERPFQCQGCNKAYSDAGVLKKHQYRCLPKPANWRSPLYTSSFLASRKITDHSRHKLWSSRISSLKRHLGRLTSIKPATCASWAKIKRGSERLCLDCWRCGRQFTTGKQSRRHLTRMHRAPWGFGCCQCWRKFTRRPYMLLHKKLCAV